MDPFFGNILVRRDARDLRRHWLRRPFVPVLLLGGLVQLAVCANLELILGHKPDDVAGLYFWFTALHVLIQVVLPLHTLWKTHGAGIRSTLDESLATPLPHSHLFGWLWSRAFFPFLAIALAIYLPLLIPYPWLRSTWMTFDLLADQAAAPHFAPLRELPADLLLGLLFALPWLRISRRMRVTLWTFAAIILFLLPWLQIHDFRGLNSILSPPRVVNAAPPVGGTASGEPVANTDVDNTGNNGTDEGVTRLIVYPSLVAFHPLVTLFYLFVTSAWGAGIGVYFGLRARRITGREVSLVLLCGPVAEWGVLHLFCLTGSSSLYDGWFYLINMLWFYMTSCGAVWLAVKWNVLLYLARRPIPME